MFTGIVEELGTVETLAAENGGHRLTVSARRIMEDLAIDHSVATNGVCLTAVALTPSGFVADVTPETLRRSTLGQLRAGDRVCLERSVTLATRLGGHLVQGHIDGTATIVSIEAEGNQRLMTFQVAPEIGRYIVNKGFVALDGASLTTMDCHPERFSIALIPHSAALTTLGVKAVGDSVNVEVDCIAKYVERFVQAR